MGFALSLATISGLATLLFLGSATPHMLVLAGIDTLCITEGNITQSPNGALHIDTSNVRAILRYATPQVAEVRFQYLGSTADMKPLASGEVRTQIGLKLQAANTCNLIYVMWRLSPVSGIVISIKRNPGLSTHKQCGARGYQTIGSTPKTAAWAARPGEVHELRAELTGLHLTVLADGREAWNGQLPALIGEFDGPVGLRTDNGRFSFTYSVGSRPPDVVPVPARECRQIESVQ